jgi:hypothetical protein
MEIIIAIVVVVIGAVLYFNRKPKTQVTTEVSYKVEAPVVETAKVEEAPAEAKKPRARKAPAVKKPAAKKTTTRKPKAK